MSLPPPVPTPVVGSPEPTGSTLVKMAWTALRADKKLLTLPLVGGAASLLALAPFAVAFVLIPSNAGWARSVVGAVAAFVVALISNFFAVALAAGAHSRMSGGTPTLQSAIAVAWRRRKAVLGWAFMSTVVALVLNFIESKIKFAGPLLRLLGGLAWSLASFFAIPIIAANDIGPVDALKLSASTFKDRWGSAVRVQLRMGLISFGVVLLLFVGAAAAIVAWSAAPALGVLVGLVVVVAFIAAILVLGAITSYARVALYRYASGLPTPGFATAGLAAAIVPKGSRRGH